MQFSDLGKGIDMPNKLKKSSEKTDSTNSLPLATEVGNIVGDMEVPTASEVVFKRTWHIKNFIKTVSKRSTMDSPGFSTSVNGNALTWNMAIRFWKGPSGKKVTNPVVLCLNLTGCEVDESAQARVRFQFGVWDAGIRHWECCSVERVVLNLQNSHELLSVGYKSLSILDRHVDVAGDVCIMVKIQLILTEEERHSLSQDLGRVISRPYTPECDGFFDTLVKCLPGNENEKPLRAHSLIINARSPTLASCLKKQEDPNNKYMKYILTISESREIVQELINYLYTDKVENMDHHANKLLAMATRFGMPGLVTICERTLLESITPNNVANILLLADQCRCENLRKAALHYCEDSETIKGSVHIGKTLAWRVMEMVNPDLFQEACESVGSSSSNLDSPGSHSGDM